MDKDFLVRKIVLKYLEDNNTGTTEYKNNIDLLTKIWCMPANFQDGVTPLLDLIPESPSNEEQLKYLIEDGNLSIGSGNYDQAIERYSDAIRINPNASDLYLKRAAAHIKKSDYQLAIQDLHKSLELNPKDPICYARLSFCYWCLNDQENSMKIFSCASENGIDDDVLNNLQPTIRKYPYHKTPISENPPIAG